MILALSGLGWIDWMGGLEGGFGGRLGGLRGRLRAEGGFGGEGFWWNEVVGTRWEERAKVKGENSGLEGDLRDGDGAEGRFW